MKASKYIFIAAAALSLTSCSDELSGTDWSPGEVCEKVGVFFAQENESLLTLLYDEAEANIVVKRIISDDALTVPVTVVTANEGMVIPESVTFAPGEASTSLIINCREIPSETLVDLSLEIPQEYISPYAAGASDYNAQVIVSRWENVSPTGLTDFYLLDWSNKDMGYLPIQSEMTHFVGSNRYRVHNFLNTEVDFTFDLQESPYKSGYYRIIPLGNQLLYADYGWGDQTYYNGWWFVSQEYDPTVDEDIWPNVYWPMANGNVDTIYYITFFWYDDARKNEFCYVSGLNKAKATAQMGCYGYTDEDMTDFTPYMNIRFSWPVENVSSEN